MNDTLTRLLTKTKLILGISAMLITVFVFFFSMRGDIDANVINIDTNRNTVQVLQETNQVQHAEMRDLLNENNTNIKLLQHDVYYITKAVDKIAKSLEEKE